MLQEHDKTESIQVHRNGPATVPPNSVNLAAAGGVGGEVALHALTLHVAGTASGAAACCCSHVWQPADASPAAAEWRHQAPAHSDSSGGTNLVTSVQMLRLS